MNKTKIEWTDYTWNPIKGICPVGCWYCYARAMYKRFHRPNYLTFHPKELESPYKLKKPSKIFACSTIELFHPAISEKWRSIVFRVIEDLPQHTFQVLTKLPQNIDRKMPDNVWLGASVESDEHLGRISRLLKATAKIKFVSYEPLLGYPAIPGWGIDWMIIGRLTGHGKKHDPPRDWLESLVEIGHGCGYPIFLKNNLRDIWGGSLIQEWPTTEKLRG